MPFIPAAELLGIQNNKAIAAHFLCNDLILSHVAWLRKKWASMDLSIFSLLELIPVFRSGLFLAWRQAHCMPKRSFIARTSDCTCRKCIPYPGWMSSLMPLISSRVASPVFRTAFMSSLIRWIMAVFSWIFRSSGIALSS